MGLKIEPDDLQVGSTYAILGLKGRRRPIPQSGAGFQVKAIELPFAVVSFVNGSCGTLDVRCLDLMRISPEFWNAQCQGERANSCFGAFGRQTDPKG